MDVGNAAPHDPIISRADPVRLPMRHAHEGTLLAVQPGREWQGAATVIDSTRRNWSSPVGEINDAAIVDALRRQLTLASAKQVVAAGNLANINTPGFRAREVDFDRVLDGRLQAAAQLVATNDRHIGMRAVVDPAVRETVDQSARRDGNTVQLDRELLTMTRAAGEFAAAQTALAAKFRLVRYAINEAR